MIGLVWSVGVGLGHIRNIYFSTTRRNISHVCHSLVRFPDLLWDIHGRRGTWRVTHQLTDFSDYFALVAGARQRSLPSVLPRGGVGMGGCLCWGAHDCLHSGFNILFFSTLLLYFRESSCPLEFWWSQQSGGSGEAPASKFLREKNLFSGNLSSPMSRSPASPWPFQGIFPSFPTFKSNIIFYFSRFLALFVIAICKHKSARL